MHVIGTAGHVDHGKTTLIEALTGINPDRLPEEKARGMTIDLGFAWFPGAGGEAIGVIDVPGHERFIRNMVAGAWSLDCALLLVAADDGWMQQTQDHALVLAALGVPAVILVVTKTDMVGPERVEAVRVDALARSTSIFGFTPEAVEVSAIAGRNVDELKRLIIATLAGLGASGADRDFPFLYVDRIFSIKGSGLVVTGSLKGGPLKGDDELLLLPQGETLRVRGIQTYNEFVETAYPTSRVALNLQKTRSEISRGNCITRRGAPFSCERQIIARIAPLEEIRNHSEIEVALGTGHQIAELHYLDDRAFARLELREPLPALWNQSFLLIRHGGSAILGTGRALWFGEVPREDRRRLTGLLSALLESKVEDEDEDRLLLELRLYGLIRLAGVLPERLRRESVALGGWAFHLPWLEKKAAAIKGFAAQPAGISSSELEGKLRVEAEALRPILALLIERKEIAQANSLYTLFSVGEKQELSRVAQKILADIEAAGTAGFESSGTGVEGGKKELGTLIKLGLVVPLEGGIYYDRRSYEVLTSKILDGRAPGSRFTVPEAKERTGLSRKFMLPLLNRMEKDGMVRREGDFRITLAPAPPK
jgi:selenocysteine-specific elongation factor